MPGRHMKQLIQGYHVTASKIIMTMALIIVEGMI